MVNAVFFIINVIILYFMKKRKLLVSTPAEALKVMTGMLSANMIDNELVTIAGECDENGKEIPDIQQYHVRLGWLNRGDDDLIGCPCFACDFEGRRYDLGSKRGYLTAVTEFALRSAELGEWYKDFLSKIISGEIDYKLD